MREFVPGALNGLAGVLTVALSLFGPSRVTLDPALSRTSGSIIITTGLLLVIWATAHIKSAILAEVSPRLPELKQSGPYRFVRHPVYLGMTVALLGVAFFTRSWLGAISALTLFLPSVLYRASLEDLALAHRFPEQWHSYAERTGSFLPRFAHRPGQ